MSDVHPILAGVLEAPDAAGHVAFIVPAIPVGNEHVAVRIEDDMAGSEMRIGAREEGLALDNVAAGVWNEPEDGAVRPGKAVGAPVVAKQVALVSLGPGGPVIAQELSMGAAHVLKAGRGQRMIAAQPVVVHTPAVAMVINAVDDTDKAIRISLAVTQHPELAEGIVFEGIRDTQAVHQALHVRAVWFHAQDDAGGAAAADLVRRPLNVNAVIAHAHVQKPLRAPFQNEHAERVPGLALVH